MNNNITNTRTKNEDINNNTKAIKHSVPMLDDNERRELENEIVEELYRIFTHKTN